VAVQDCVSLRKGVPMNGERKKAALRSRSQGMLVREEVGCGGGLCDLIGSVKCRRLEIRQVGDDAAAGIMVSKQGMNSQKKAEKASTVASEAREHMRTGDLHQSSRPPL